MKWLFEEFYVIFTEGLSERGQFQTEPSGKTFLAETYSFPEERLCALNAGRLDFSQSSQFKDIYKKFLAQILILYKWGSVVAETR